MGILDKLFSRRRKDFINDTLMSITTQAQWTQAKYESFAVSAYLWNVISFRCIDLIARSVASVPWGIFRKMPNGMKEPITDHPVLNLLDRPNPGESNSAFRGKVTSYLLLSGNSYIERRSPNTGPNREIPRELYSLRPDRITILGDKVNNIITGYKYKKDLGNPRIFKVDLVTGQSDLLQVKLFNPLDDWYGSPPVQSTGREIDVSNEATKWQKKILQNEGRPGMVFAYDRMLGDQQFERLKKQIGADKAGAVNAGKHLVLEGGAKVYPYAWTPAEIDFLKSNQEWARRICLGFDVPPQLIGIPGDNTYNTYQEANLIFWERAVNFYSWLLTEEFEMWLIDDLTLSLQPIFDNVPALAARRDTKWKRAQGSSSFLTVNEQREITGYPPIEGGDVIMVQMSMVPLGQTEEDVDEETGTEEEQAHYLDLVELGYSVVEARSLAGLPPIEDDKKKVSKGNGSANVVYDETTIEESSSSETE